MMPHLAPCVRCQCEHFILRWTADTMTMRCERCQHETPVKLSISTARKSDEVTSVSDAKADDPPDHREAMRMALREADEVVATLRALHRTTMGYEAAPRREWVALTEEEVLRCLKWEEAAQMLTGMGMPSDILDAAKQEALEKYRALEAKWMEKQNGQV